MQTRALMYRSPHSGCPPSTQTHRTPDPSVAQLSQHGMAAAAQFVHNGVARQPITAEDTRKECAQPAAPPSASNQVPQAHASVPSSSASHMLARRTPSSACPAHAQAISWHPGPVIYHSLPLQSPPRQQGRATMLASTSNTSHETSDSISLSTFVNHKLAQGQRTTRSDISFPGITPPTIEEQLKISSNKASSQRSDQPSHGSDSSGSTLNSWRHRKHACSQLQPCSCK